MFTRVMPVSTRIDVIGADNVKADGTSLIYIDRHLVHEAPACPSSARIVCGSSVARGDKPSGIRGSQAQQQRGQPSCLLSFVLGWAATTNPRAGAPNRLHSGHSGPQHPNFIAEEF